MSSISIYQAVAADIDFGEKLMNYRMCIGPT